MISVEDAVRRICSGITPLGSERIPLEWAHGRVLARDASARLTQPPAAVSSMDGYAVRMADAGRAPVTLHVIGASPAGHPFGGSVGAGEAVRIFTGGVVPEGADAIALQENARADGDWVTLSEPATPRHIRTAGLDFHAGDRLVAKGRRLGARDLALLAAGDICEIDAQRRPIVAFAATGDELARPGEAHRKGGIVASSGYALTALIEGAGGIACDLGILPDAIEQIAHLPERAAGADAVVTVGGASVGDHDLVQRALAPKGFVLDFWKVAMRPGKPLISGQLNGKPFLGLPGNPVSGYVCALLFLRPLIAALLGANFEPARQVVRLAGSFPANDGRQEFPRARLILRDGERWAEPFAAQDSSMQSALAAADALIVRAPHAPQAREGDRIECILLDD
ncbi:MAG: molybdopterin molybdotransferase MoeA [Rhizomicrobium sp.]